MSDLVKLENPASLPPSLRWDMARPRTVGWYWFRAEADSPHGMTRLAECVVYVGRSKDTGNLRVMFTVPMDVGLMGGLFAGPIPSPLD